jgi:hypothetical protein
MIVSSILTNDGSDVFGFKVTYFPLAATDPAASTIIDAIV